MMKNRQNCKNGIRNMLKEGRITIVSLIILGFVVTLVACAPKADVKGMCAGTQCIPLEGLPQFVSVTELEKHGAEINMESTDEDSDTQHLVPCHFLIHVDNLFGFETEKFRNIDVSNLQNEQGFVELYDLASAYKADIIVDKYIREYGGEDGLYTVEWLPERRVYEITDGTIYLEVYPSERGDFMYSVLVKNLDGAEPRASEYKKYKKNHDYCITNDLRYAFHEKIYWMVINPVHSKEVQKLRNVDPQADLFMYGELQADSTAYYIADQAVDKYIRDFEGNDTIYSVSLAEKNSIGDGLYSYKIQAECGNSKLLIEYSDDTWVVMVEAQDEELDLGIASDEDIREAGRRTNLKSLQFTTFEDLDLSPITNLKNLEKLHITIRPGVEHMDLSPIGELRKLKDLYLWESNLDMSFLRRLKNLEKVEISRSRIEDLSFVKNMEGMKNLVLTVLEDTDIADLEKAKKIEVLHLEGYHIRNLEGLSGADGLRLLFLSEEEKDPEKREQVSLEVLSGMEHLESLTLARINVEDITPVADLANLERLILVDIGLEDIRCLASLKNLKELEIYGEGSTVLRQQAEEYIPWLRFKRIEEYIPDHFG